MLASGGLLVSDERLRELERQWKTTGTVEDEAAWLQAKAQAGLVSDARLSVLAVLGYPAATRLQQVPDPHPLELPGLDEPENTWDVFCGWFAALEQIDPSSLVAAGVVLGELLLPICEPDAYEGDLAKMLGLLRQALPETDGPNFSRLVLEDMEPRIQEINEIECALDSGSIMPYERTAARALTWVGLEFTSAERSDWLGSAAMGLDISSEEFFTPREIADALRARMPPLLLGYER